MVQRTKARKHPMTSDTTVTACLLLIGNEILSGRTKDANLSWLAEALGAAGIRLREARVIPDDPDEIIAAVNHCRARYDHVFTTGGIGTHFINGALNRDYAVIMGVTILLGTLTITFNMLVDIIYAWIDPKIRY
jgi:FAD/FMN-containing dehydrogenase